MSVWQPIETAPKDMAVLGWWGNSHPPLGEIHYGVVRWGHRGWVEPETGDDYLSDPTHWMPLPEPPVSP